MNRLERLREDTDIIRNIRKGDEKSLDLLFQSAYPHLCAYANKFLNDTDEAEEIVQEVFYKLWQNRAQLDEQFSLNSYLFVAVKNGCLKFLEHQKVKDKYKVLLEYVYRSGPLNSPHESLVAGELETQFNRALEQLPAQCRKVFELSRNEEFTYQEIAYKLQISRKTVETQMSRALAKIRLQLKDYILIAFLLNF